MREITKRTSRSVRIECERRARGYFCVWCDFVISSGFLNSYVRACYSGAISDRTHLCFWYARIVEQLSTLRTLHIKRTHTHTSDQSPNANDVHLDGLRESAQTRERPPAQRICEGMRQRRLSRRLSNRSGRSTTHKLCAKRSRALVQKC